MSCYPDTTGMSREDERLAQLIYLEAFDPVAFAAIKALIEFFHSEDHKATAGTPEHSAAVDRWLATQPDDVRAELVDMIPDIRAMKGAGSHG